MPSAFSSSGDVAAWFVFDTRTGFTPAALGIDRITDFVSGTDKILLSKLTFTALTSPANSSLASSEFATINEVVNGVTVAGVGLAQIVFNQSNGDLFYNPDGATTGFGSGGQFAT